MAPCAKWTICVFGFILVLGIHFQKGIAQTQAKHIAHRVNICPRNEAEWQKASSRLNCTNDDLKPVNRYHCLPADNKTTLLEFCYKKMRTQVIKGLCMVFIERKEIVNHYNCSMFKEGCPNTSYYSDEAYRFPKCIKINPVGRCYEADCPPSTKNTELNEGSPNILTIAVPIIGVGVLSVLAWIGFFVCSRKCQQHIDETNYEQTILIDRSLPEEIELDIKRLGIDYILHSLPSDETTFPKISKLLNIPMGLLYWSKGNREKYVNSWKAWKMSVYSGSGMVIGCAEAGKTTLVKKLKGLKNLTPEHTVGLEIHPHVFKLGDEESTIKVCTAEEKEKGCLCLTPTTLVHQEANKPDDKTKINKEIKKSSWQTIASKQEIDPCATPVERYQQYDTLTNSFNTDAMQNEVELQQVIDVTDCMPSVYEGNLKMLSLLDFAGHSAYYASHHIFFSPRAFFILVVDMTKKLEDLATDACKEEDLIYSTWKYIDYVKYWLGSIHTYSSKTAPVILVATHYDRMQNKSNEKESEVLQNYFEKICERLPSSLKEHLSHERVFCVAKKSDRNMKELKQCIASTLKAQAHWGETVPLSWAQLQTLLNCLKSHKTYLFSDLNTEVQKRKDLNIDSEEELIRALTFFHEVGMIMFRSEIKNIIILDVQWFVDAFKCIIQDKRHKRKDIKALRDYKKLDKFGLLSGKLLDDLWKDNEFKTNKDSLVNHMQQLDMLAKLSHDLWYVPCMNKEKYNADILANCNVSSTLCFLFEFVPFVIFHRLIVACINDLKLEPWNTGKMCIYHTVTILTCEDNQRLLIGIRENKDPSCPEYSYSIELQAMETSTGGNNREFSSRNKTLKEDICCILNKLTKTFPSSEKPFQIGYRCKVEPYSKSSESHIILEGDMDKSRVECSICKPVHVVQDVQFILGCWQSVSDVKKSSEESK